MSEMDVRGIGIMVVSGELLWVQLCGFDDASENFSRKRYGFTISIAKLKLRWVMSNSALIIYNSSFEPQVRLFSRVCSGSSLDRFL